MANKKAEILTMDGQVVSPITLATNVLLDDGRTAQDLLDSRDESMFSPTITTSSSISKVGQGDNVDFSENVIDGAYKSCVLKGKTLVNYNTEGNDRNEYVCMSSVEEENVTVNGTVEGLVKSAILKGQTMVNNFPSLTTGNFKKNTTTFEDGLVVFKQGSYLQAEAKNIKPSTVYTYILDIRSNTLDGQGDLFQIIHSASGVSATHKTITKEIGVIKIKFTTLSDLTNKVLELNTRPNATTGEIKIKSIMLLEGDYTNVDIPYFEGMQSVKMPVLTTSNLGNLISINDLEQGGLFNTSGVPTNFDFIRSDFIEVTHDEYTLSHNSLAWTKLFEYDENKEFIRLTNTRGDRHTTEVTENTKYIRFSIELSFSQVNSLNISLCPNESTNKLPFKSNILTVNEDVELGSVGEVKDELDLLTGKISQRTDIRPYQEGDESNSEVLTDMTNTRYKLAQEVVKTVDLSDNHVYSYNDTTHYDCSSAKGSLVPTLSIEEGVKYQAIIKPSTKYSVVFNRTKVASGLTVDLGGATANVVSTAVGKTIVQITTPSTLSHNYVIFKGLGNVIKDVQVIEGDVVGDEPYFEGMVDVKNPVMTNCNMLDIDGAHYKSNTISTNEVVLRSLPNGVSDTLDLETGEYVQRIGEIVLDGSENWQTSWDGLLFFVHPNSKPYSKLIAKNYITTDERKATDCIYKGNSGLAIVKNGISTVAGLKQWLSQNPITVQYELETPITTTIDLKQHPFAYKDGYVVLTSSSEEISLTPTIEYSLIANRLGQIQTNQKLVEKQQAQIDELESMVIANLVNTQYQQALNEIKLGVK